MVPTRAGVAGWVSFPGQRRGRCKPSRCIRASPPGCSKASALPCIPSWHRRPLRPQPESPRSPCRLCRPCPRSLRRSCPRSRRSCLRFLSRSRPRLLRGPTRRPHCQGLLPTRQPPARPHRHPRLTPSMRQTRRPRSHASRRPQARRAPERQVRGGSAGSSLHVTSTSRGGPIWQERHRGWRAGGSRCCGTTRLASC
jgi:hypothetical protein